MLLLHNTVQPYAWGPLDGLVELVGSQPTGGPEAELWVGTHPGAPSVVADDPAGRTLAEVIAADPARWLGEELAGRGHRALPFLLKVLAIGRPLSLQAHPTGPQAEAGFDREDREGIPVDDPRRTYRDRSAKPEALVALVETWALCGFRPPAAAAELVGALEMATLAPLVQALSSSDPDAHRDALSWLLHLQGADRDSVATGLAAAVAHVDVDDLDDPCAWVRRLVDQDPGDPTAVAPLLLEVLRLAPGDAVHLPAGNLHAYLRGAGIEIMAASDNVLRGGLTPKHIDVDELLAIVAFEPGVPSRPRRSEPLAGVVAYDAGEESFALAVVDPAGGEVTVQGRGPALLLATGGEVDVAGADGGLSISGGDAAFLAPGEGPVTVSGSGRLWWATTGDALPR